MCFSAIAIYLLNGTPAIQGYRGDGYYTLTAVDNRPIKIKKLENGGPLCLQIRNTANKESAVRVYLGSVVTCGHTDTRVFLAGNRLFPDKTPLTIQRERAGISEYALANRSGIPISIIDSIENYEVQSDTVSVEVLKAMAQTLECAVCDLMEGSDESLF